MKLALGLMIGGAIFYYGYFGVGDGLNDATSVSPGPAPPSDQESWTNIVKFHRAAYRHANSNAIAQKSVVNEAIADTRLRLNANSPVKGWLGKVTKVGERWVNAEVSGAHVDAYYENIQFIIAITEENLNSEIASLAPGDWIKFSGIPDFEMEKWRLSSDNTILRVENGSVKRLNIN